MTRPTTPETKNAATAPHITETGPSSMCEMLAPLPVFCPTTIEKTMNHVGMHTTACTTKTKKRFMSVSSLRREPDETRKRHYGADCLPAYRLFLRQRVSEEADLAGAVVNYIDDARIELRRLERHAQGDEAEEHHAEHVVPVELGLLTRLEQFQHSPAKPCCKHQHARDEHTRAVEDSHLQSGNVAVVRDVAVRHVEQRRD